MTGLSAYDKRVDPASACAGKHRYPNRVAAHAVADRSGKRKDVRLNAYACAACSGWHIGSQITNLAAKKKAARKGVQRSGDYMVAVRRQQLEDLPVEQRAALRKGRG